MSDLQEQAEDLLRIAIIAQMASKAEEEEKKVKQKRKRIWVREWIGRRPDEAILFSELRDEDPEKFRTDFRLDPKDFDKLLLRYLLRKLLKFCSLHLKHYLFCFHDQKQQSVQFNCQDPPKKSKTGDFR